MRLPDWQSRLATVMRDAAARPFAWGEHDCVTFAAACIEAVTGVDPIADVRTQWADERQALRLLAAGGGLRALLGQRLLPREVPALAQPGDVGVCLQDGRDGLCVCGGVNWHMPAKDGLATLDHLQVVQAWRCSNA